VKKISISILAFVFAIGYFSMALAADCEAKKKWTIMVYINADNSLDRYGTYDMIEMEKVGSGKDINIVTQIDRNELPARRYYVTKRSENPVVDDWNISSKNVAELGEVDMGDYNEFVRFAEWGIANYPAERYMIIMWNHGNGWSKNKNSQLVKGISFDDESGNNISTDQMAFALAKINQAAGGKLDILGVDACLMQMIEVLYEIKDYVKYVVASEEMIPANGWPYDLILKPLADNPDIASADYAKLLCDAYKQYYTVKGAGTLSAIDCSFIDGLAEKINEISNIVIDDIEINRPAVHSAINSVQYFEYKEHIDLGNFLEILLSKTKSEKLITALNEAHYYYKKAVMNSVSTTEGLKNATGIAIYFPKFTFSDHYSYLKFSKYNWDEMVKTFQKL